MFSRSKRKLSLSAMILFYLIAGLMHFATPLFYVGIMPEWLPEHELFNWLAGGLEILLAVGMLIPKFQSSSAWSIGIMLLVFLLVIHIPLIFRFDGFQDIFWWGNILRIPVQYLLIRWALSFVGPRPLKLFSTADDDAETLD